MLFLLNYTGISSTWAKLCRRLGEMCNSMVGRKWQKSALFFLLFFPLICDAHLLKCSECVHNDDKEAENCVGVVIFILFCLFIFSVSFPEKFTLVLTKSASCFGVQRVTNLAFQGQITKSEA